MVIGRDFAFLETRDTFPDGSCVLVRRISTRCDARATDMCVLAFLSNTLSLLQSVGTFFVACITLYTRRLHSFPIFRTFLSGID